MQSTGTTVTASTVAAITANVFVKASGWNSLPAWPVSANTGMNASTMIAIEKNTGRPTSRVDSRTVAHTARRSRTLIPLRSIWRNAFSVTTMPASTSTPIAMAIPARLMMFDEMPTYMARNDISTASGAAA